MKHNGVTPAHAEEEHAADRVKPPTRCIYPDKDYYIIGIPIRNLALGASFSENVSIQ